LDVRHRQAPLLDIEPPQAANIVDPAL